MLPSSRLEELARLMSDGCCQGGCVQALWSQENEWTERKNNPKMRLKVLIYVWHLSAVILTALLYSTLRSAGVGSGVRTEYLLETSLRMWDPGASPHSVHTIYSIAGTIANAVSQIMAWSFVCCRWNAVWLFLECEYQEWGDKIYYMTLIEVGVTSS